MLRRKEIGMEDRDGQKRVIAAWAVKEGLCRELAFHLKDEKEPPHEDVGGKHLK